MSFKQKLVPLIILTVLITIMLSVCPSGAYADTVEIKEDGWEARLTNVDWHFNVDGKLDPGLFPPKLDVGVIVTFGVQGDFDVIITKPNLSGDLSVRSKLDMETQGMYVEPVTDTYLKYVTSVIPLVDYDIKGFFFAGANHPVRVKGHFKNVATVNLRTVDSSHTYDPQVTYTSIEPLEPDQETVVVVGSSFENVIGLGKIGAFGYGFGPILNLRAGIMADGKASAKLEKDQITITQVMDDSVKDIHTCTENGREGCVSGEMQEFKKLFFQATATLKAKMPFFDPVVLLEKKWDPVEDVTDIISIGFGKYVNSLTWQDGMKYGTKDCQHHVYQVPVAVWRDQEMTSPVNNVKVAPNEAVQVDSNVRSLTSATTGKNANLPAGRANLYLPYKNGQYTIKASGIAGLEVSEPQPSAMKRGANEQVNIILGLNEKATYTVRKEWDIDLENKDRPESIQVLLQKATYNQSKLKWLSDGVFAWEGVQIVTLNEGNNWSASFDAVQVYELTDDNKLEKIKYRVRELKAAEEDADDQDLEQACGRVVRSRFDLDNTNVLAVLKGQVTDWNKMWQLQPTWNGLKALGKQAMFPRPQVQFKIPEYTDMLGNQVEEHTTDYFVEYTEDGYDVTIKNTAILKINSYKRWMDFSDDDDKPKEVYLVLQSRIKEEWADKAKELAEAIPGVGQAVSNIIGGYFPVIKPLDGNMVNILEIIGLDTLAKLDVAGFLSVPVAIGKAKAIDRDKDPLANPLLEWRVSFTVKKYGFLGISGIPVEFETAELSSAIIKDIIQYLTGFNIPISISLTGGGYATAPGKAYQIPLLDKDWERAANVINIRWGGSEGTADEDTAIGGTKHWVNDKEEDRPDSLIIHIKDGDKEIGSVTIKKEDNEGRNDWVWALRQSDIKEDGVKLDTKKTYTITEEYPDGYVGKDKYQCEVKGHDLFNRWTGGKQAKIVVEKTYQGPDSLKPQNSVTADIKCGDEVLIGNITLSASGSGWRAEIKDEQDKLKGKDVGSLSVQETAVDGKALDPEKYQVTYSGPSVSQESDGTPVITFHINNRGLSADNKAEIRVKKIWEGEDASTTHDPISVTVKDGSGITVATGTVSEWNTAVKIAEVPERDDSGKVISYTLEETIPDGYTSVVTSDTSHEQESGKTVYTFTVTNKKTETVTVSGTKTWNDNNDELHLRPDSIQIHIIGSGRGSVRELTVSAADEWSWNVGGLPRYDEDGEEITYSVMEGSRDDDPDKVDTTDSEGDIPNYTAQYEAPSLDGNTWTCNIKNNFTGKKLNISVRKEWIDDNDQKRPDAVTVELLADGMVIDSLNLTGDDWAAVFPQQTGYLNGNEVQQFSVRERMVPDGYESTVSGDVDAGFTITNTRSTIELIVEKEWEDNNNEKGERPTEVTVQLMNGNAAIGDPVILNEGNQWSYTFEHLDKTINGREADYTVREENVPDGYTASVAKPQSNKIIVTNSSLDLTRDITVTKKWDAEISADSRPDVVVELLADDTVISTQELKAEDNWTYTFTGQDVYNDDKTKIVYSVRELDPESVWDVAYTGDMQSGLVITNSPKKTDIHVSKEWNDDNDAWGMRPETVTFILKQDGSELQRETIGASDGWEAVFKDLPVYQSGTTIPYSYTVTEEAVEGYETLYSGSADVGFIVSNNLKKAKVTVTKVWDDDDDRNGLRPDSVTVYLLANGTEKETCVLSRYNNWKYTFGDLDIRDAQNNPISYGLSEAYVRGYITSSITGDAQSGFVITNTPETTSVTVSKIWEDDYNASGARPEEIRVYLYADDTLIEEKNINEEDDNWQTTFSDLLAWNRNGTEIVYTVDEFPVEGYTKAILEQTHHHFTITNTRMPLIAITVTKVWDDESDKYGNRPDAIDVFIVCETNPDLTTDIFMQDYENYYVDNTGDKWSAGAILPVFTNDVRNVYHVEEPKVPAGYEISKIGGSAQMGFEVTNTLIQIDIPVEKIWDDDDDAAGLRPESVMVYLYNDSLYRIEDTVELSEANGWSHAFKVPEYCEGKPANYRISEDVPDGYSAEITRDPEGKFWITNHVNYRDITVTKVWLDDETDHPAVTMHLFTDLAKEGDMVEVGAPVTIDGPDDDGVWQGVFPSVCLVDPSGRWVDYEVREDPVDGYPVTMISYDINNVTVYNEPVAKYIIVGKQWADDDECMEDRPESVKIDILKDGTVIAELTLSEENDWVDYYVDYDYSPDADPKPVYSLEEKEVPGYTPVWETEEMDEEGYHYLIGEVTNHREASYSVEYYYQENGQYPEKPDRTESRTGFVGSEIQLTEQDLESGSDKYSWDSAAPNVLNGVITKDGSLILKVYFHRLYTITYDPNGGTIEQSTSPVSEQHAYGEQITIRNAPVRSGWIFRYWKGSRYDPGDSYTVTGDHTFTAKWKHENPLSYQFTFTKKWSGQIGESIDWVMYDANGRVMHELFNKSYISDSEWYYITYMENPPGDAYIIEKPLPGYGTSYQNIGAHALETDRCYNGGTIINYRIPATDDTSDVALWIALTVLSISGLIGLVVLSRKKTKYDSGR